MDLPDRRALRAPFLPVGCSRKARRQVNSILHVYKSLALVGQALARHMVRLKSCPSPLPSCSCSHERLVVNASGWGHGGIFIPLFDWKTIPSSRPAVAVAPGAGAVKAGRRPPPKAARSGLDGPEHGAKLEQAGARDFMRAGASLDLGSSPLIECGTEGRISSHPVAGAAADTIIPHGRGHRARVAGPFLAAVLWNPHEHTGRLPDPARLIRSRRRLA